MRLRRSPPAGRQRLRRPPADTSVPNPFAYRSRRSDSELNTGRGQPRASTQAAKPGAAHGRFWIQRFGLIILSVAVIASLINVLTLSTTARVVPLLPNRSSDILGSPLAYSQEADKLLSSSILNRNKLTVNTGQISRQMLQKFPQLTNVSVTIPLMAHRPIVYIEPAPAAVILDNSSGAYALDSSGKALVKTTTPLFMDLPNVPVVTDQSGLKLQLGREALPSTDISFIQTVVAELAAKKLAVSGMTLPPAASELDIQLSGKPYIAKFNLENDDPQQQAGTLIATINQLQQQNVTPAHYIDVRVDGRAYYQ